jgi:quercetin dioxygenase-like cupin family protein
MNIAHVDKSQAQEDPKLSPYMEGEARIQQLFNPAQANGHTILMVYFNPGARTRPHIHKQGQILHITEGKGIVTINTEERVVNAGDVVVIPPGAWHWHGATPDTAMSHLAIQGPEGDLIWDVDMKDWAYSYQERGG